MAQGLNEVMETSKINALLATEVKLGGYPDYDEPRVGVSSPRQAVYSNYKGQETSTPRRE
jgi:hypothetical protein